MNMIIIQGFFKILYNWFFNAILLQKLIIFICMDI